MFLVNLVLVMLLLGYIGMGVKDGFVHTLGRFLGAILGFLAARAWSIWFVGIIGMFVPAGWARLAAFIVIFIVITRVFGMVFKMVDGIFELMKLLPFLKSIDKFLGAFLGFVEGLIFIGGVIYLILTFKLSPTLITSATSSSVAVWIYKIFQSTLSMML